MVGPDQKSFHTNYSPTCGGVPIANVSQHAWHLPTLPWGDILGYQHPSDTLAPPPPCGYFQMTCHHQQLCGQSDYGEFHIVAAVEQTVVMAPKMLSLRTAWNFWNNTNAMGGTNRKYNSCSAKNNDLLSVRVFTLRVRVPKAKMFYHTREWNTLADDTSRHWGMSDPKLLAHFNSQNPQRHSWQLFHPQPSTMYMIITALHVGNNGTGSSPY